MYTATSRGQVLVIGAVAMVVLIGIAGLVIDLGFSWMLRRAEQNAVDPAAVAAARHIPDGDVLAMEEAACFFARENGFFPDATSYDLGASGCVPANDPNGASLDVNWPPVSAAGYVGDASYVEIALNRTHPTFFSRIFGFEVMSVSSSAVAANGTEELDGGQLVALDPASCGAGQIRGSGVVDVEGSIYVRSLGTACPGPINNVCSGTDGGFRFSGSTARLITPQVSVRGACGQNANPFPNNCSPPSSCAVREGAGDISDPYAFPTPDLASMPAPSGSTSSGPLSMTGCDEPSDNGCTFGGAPGSIYTVNPGVYYGGWTVTREVRLNPGIYYIAGGGIQVSSEGRLVGNGSTPGDGEGRIMIYSTDGPNCAASGGRKCQGTLLIEGSGGFQARSYQLEPYQGLLLWQAEGTSRTYPTDTDFSNDKIRIAGTGDLDFWGLIYAPKSLVELQGGGSGTGTAGVQVMAWRFDIGGSANLDMPLDPAELPLAIIKGLVH